jgi:DNA-binding response OmpR family regulator
MATIDDTLPGDELGGTVLVCEDDQLVQHLIERILSTAAYRVLISPSPHDALDLAAEHRDVISLLITDFTLPGMSGLEFASLFQTQLPDAPVLFVSGYDLETVRDGGELPPHSDYLQKPFDRDELLARLAGLLDR